MSLDNIISIIGNKSGTCFVHQCYQICNTRHNMQDAGVTAIESAKSNIQPTFIWITTDMCTCE